MRRLWVLLLCLPAFPAGVVPNRFIVELSSDSVARHISRLATGGAARSRLHSQEAERQRALVRAEQAAIRAKIQEAEGKVLGGIETVGNALFVEIPDAKASRLASIPGVAKVHPVPTFKLMLDHALPLHHVPQAWSQVGISNAGAGIKIALIDTGIDIKHPGFADAGFTMPAGFPVTETQADQAYTNRKVIVARSYANLFPNADPDPSPADHVGHGTGTAMVAGGVSNAGPLATICGVAPQAWLGAYKVFGTPGYNDQASEDSIIMAIEDAVNDGMDIISMSLGGVASRMDTDLEVQTLNAVEALGVIVVAAAGNAGPDPMTISSPADAPSVIAVGAMGNDRFFADSVILPDNSSLVAVPGNAVYPATSITGTVLDISTLDGNGLGCASFPAGSLTGAVALISRGTCTFESKIDHAQAAGAAAVLMYDNVAGESPIIMGTGAATLPAVMISQSDGLALKPQLTKGFAATVQFIPSPHYMNPASIATFSSAGPNIDFSIKPDLLAVGQNVYTAAQKLDPNGEMYNAAGYVITQGTSFATPLVAGAAAVLKEARPGLTSDQYRSLLINSADAASLVPGTPAGVQQGGAGVLNVLAALSATVTASPVSLSFGTGGSSVNASQSLTLTNVGTVPDTFQLSVAASGASAPVPQLTTTSVALAPGQSAILPVQFQAASLAAGEYQGVINVQGLQSAVTTHVPYWYAVPAGQPARITVLYNSQSGSAGTLISEAIYFRVTDATGLPVTAVQPTVTAVSAGALAGSVSSIDSYIPDAFTFPVGLAAQAGNNVYQIRAGSASTTVTIVGQ